MTPSEEEDPPSDEILAGEYALGVLDADQRALAEARSDQDPAFAAEVFAWVRRLSALVDAAPTADPSPALWARIEQTLTARQAPAPPAAPPAANDDAPRLALWRAWAIGATAVAACAILALGAVGLRRPTGPLTATHDGQTLVARLGLKESGAPAVTVAYDPGSATIYAAPDGDFSIPKARSAELWLIPADGKPRPMGVIDPTKPATMPMPPEFKTLAKDQAAVALSIEPEGGSKSGAPTGPVIAAGTLSIV